MPATRRSPQDITQAIRAAAIEIVGEEGLRAVTHRAVAARAGVSLSSTTYHYATKADILAAATRELTDRELATAVQAVDALEAAVAAGGRTVDPAWAVDQLLAYTERGDATAGRAAYALQLHASSDPQLAQELAEWIDRMAEQTARALRLLGADDPERGARLVIAATDGLRMEALTTPDGPAIRRRTRDTLELLVDRLLA